MCSQLPVVRPAELSVRVAMSTAESSNSRKSAVAACVSSPWKQADPAQIDSQEYVECLNKLGFYMAKMVPAEVADGAITCMGEAPTRPLLAGSFVSKQTVKQETLLPRCFQVNFGMSVSWFHRRPESFVDARWQLRLANDWLLHALLEFEEFQERRPSKTELYIVLQTFNKYFKACWSTC